MPLSYHQFINKKTGATVPLGEIDTLLCADIGKPCCKNTYSSEFMQLTDVGDIAWGSSKWNQRKFDALFTQAPESKARKTIFKKYLNGVYIYDCWYQR